MRSSDRSITGVRWLLERTTKYAPSTSAAANDPSTRAESQPHSSPLTTASTSDAIARANTSPPSRSGMRLRPGARLSTRTRRASRKATTPTGMFTRNTKRQLDAVISRPPSGGPMPAASAATAAHSATACMRSSATFASSTIASELGTRAAAPAAWIRRAAINALRLGAAAHSAEASVNSSSANENTRLRPRRSASCPPPTRKAANTML